MLELVAAVVVCQAGSRIERHANGVVCVITATEDGAAEEECSAPTPVDRPRAQGERGPHLPLAAEDAPAGESRLGFAGELLGSFTAQLREQGVPAPWGATFGAGIRYGLGERWPSDPQ